MMRIICIFLLLGSIGAYAQSSGVSYFQRLLIDSQDQPSEGVWETTLKFRASQAPGTDDPAPLMTARLEKIARVLPSYAKFRDHFLQPVGPSPAIQIHYQNSPAQPLFSPIFLPEPPFEFLAQEYRDAVSTYPNLFEAFGEIKKFVLDHATELLQQKHKDYQALEHLYSEKLSLVMEQAKGDNIPRESVKLVLKAAQMPSIGFRSPPGPTLDPESMGFFEYLALSHLDISYKQELVQCITKLDATEAAGTIGLLLAQAVYAERQGFTEPAFRTYVFQLLDFFKVHPSETSALVLSEALALSDFSTSSFKRYLELRLDTPEWQRLIYHLDSPERIQTLRDFTSNIPRK